MRPVAEIFYESDVSLFRTGSALVGAIWQVQDDIAIDFGLRGARTNGQTAGEIRAGQPQLHEIIRSRRCTGSRVGPPCAQ